MQLFNDHNIFGTRLRLARKMAGLSLQELADLLQNKVSKQALSKYELGSMNPSSEVLVEIARALKMKSDYFFKKNDLHLGHILFRKKHRYQKNQKKR